MEEAKRLLKDKTISVIDACQRDKFSPKRLVFSGLLVTAVMNFLILFCQNHIQMTAVWCVNGLAQAFMWPPMVRLLVGLFEENDYIGSRNGTDLAEILYRA